jgi:predicted DNA-binding transcriptional regulator AlpA
LLAQASNVLVGSDLLSELLNERLSLMCEYLDTQAVAAKTGIPIGTLRFWRHSGRGPASFALGRKIVYRRAEVERWIAEQEASTIRGGATAAAAV